MDFVDLVVFVVLLDLVVDLVVFVVLVVAFTAGFLAGVFVVEVLVEPCAKLIAMAAARIKDEIILVLMFEWILHYLRGFSSNKFRNFQKTFVLAM